MTLRGNDFKNKMQETADIHKHPIPPGREEEDATWAVVNSKLLPESVGLWFVAVPASTSGTQECRKGENTGERGQC